MQKEINIIVLFQAKCSRDLDIALQMARKTEPTLSNGQVLLRLNGIEDLDITPPTTARHSYSIDANPHAALFYILPSLAEADSPASAEFANGHT